MAASSESSEFIDLNDHRPQCLCTDRSEEYLFIGTKEGSILKIDNRTKKIVSTINTDLVAIESIIQGQNNDLWACGAYIKKFDIDTLSDSNEKKCHSENVLGIALSTDSIISVSEDCSVKSSKIGGLSSEELYKHEGSIISFAFSQKHKLIATSCIDQQLIIYSLVSKRILATKPTPSKIRSIKFIGDSDEIVTGDHDGKIAIWKTKNLELVLENLICDSRIKSLDVLKKNLIAVGSFDQTVKVLEKSAGKLELISEYKNHSDWVRFVMFLNKENTAVVSCGDDNKVYFNKLEMRREEKYDDDEHQRRNCCEKFWDCIKRIFCCCK